METINDDDSLTELLSQVGAEFGFTEVVGEFVQFEELRMKWRRTYQWISFDVPDYLKGADRSMLESLFRTVYAKIRGDTDVSAYEDAVNEYLFSDGFAREHQRTHIDRRHGKASEHGMEIYEQLARDGIAPTIRHLSIIEVPATRDYSMSSMFRVIAVPLGTDMDSDGFRACIAVLGQMMENARRDGMNGHPEHSEEYLGERFIRTLKEHGLYDKFIQARERGIIWS